MFVFHSDNISIQTSQETAYLLSTLKIEYLNIYLSKTENLIINIQYYWGTYCPKLWIYISVFLWISDCIWWGIPTDLDVELQNYKCWQKDVQDVLL